MKASQLIGRSVARTAPAVYPHGLKDYSYMNGGVTILGVSEDGHIEKFHHFTKSTSLMDPCWNDDNWVISREKSKVISLRLFGKTIIIY